MTPDELKARLLAEAEAIIKEIVGPDETTQPRTRSDIEQAALKAGQQVKASVLAALVAHRPATRGSDLCPQCGGKLKHKGKRAKWVVTQAGEVQVEREYYYCERCKTGFFPHDAVLGMTDGLYSAGMAQQMVWLSGLLPYGQCVEVFERYRAVSHRGE
jgi:hypothetical protein